MALWQSSSGAGTVGGFVAFITAMLMLVAPVKHLSDIMAPITRGLAAIERGLELLDDHPAEPGGTHRAERAQGRLALRDVVLRYRDDQAPALDGLTLDIAAGETVALVGPSGAGKSSLIDRPGLVKGRAWMPMHWGSQFMNSPGANALACDATDRSRSPACSCRCRRHPSRR